MKKIILVLIVLKSTIPVFSQAVFKVSGGASVTGSNGAYIVLTKINLLNDGTIHESNGGATIKFTGNVNSTITGNGATNLVRLQLGLNSGTVLTLLNSIKVDSEFIFSGGLLNLDNYKVDLGNQGILVNETEASKAYTTGTGYIEATRNLNSPSSVNAGNLGAIITSSSNLGNTIVRRGHRVQNNIYGSNHSILRYYDIMPANNASLNATLRFRYLQNELNGINEDTLGQWSSSDNVSWTQPGYSLRDTVNNFVEKTGINSFSRSTLSQFINTSGFKNISITNNPSVAEGDNGTKELKFIVKLNSSSASVVQVQYNTADSTATGGIDYVNNSGTLTFSPGQLTDTIRVLVNGDLVVEPDEYFLVQLSNAVNAIITTGRAKGTIHDDDNYPAISITNYSVAEGNVSDTTLMVKVRLNRSYPLPVMVNFATQDSTATAGFDYTSASGMLTFVPGDTLEFIPVTIHADRIAEPNEIININLSNAVNATLGANVRGKITIADDDPLPQIIVTNTSVSEGNNDQFNNVSFTMRLNRSYPLPITVNYQTQDSTATNGSDYHAVNGIITFLPGDTLESFTIPILGDRIVESNEIIKIILSNPVNATTNTASSRITITNDDSYPVININNVSVAEGDAGFVNAVFTVRINKRYPQDITVQYATQDITAIAGVDYLSTTGTVVFPADGDTTETITVPVLGDLLDEVNETYRIQLSNAGNATISGNGLATGTIADNDPVPAIRIFDTTATEASQNAMLRVTLNNASGKTVTVSYKTQEGTALDTLDYVRIVSDTVTFLPGETTKFVNIPIVADNITEGNETFSVILQSPTNGTTAAGQGGDNTAVVTILNSVVGSTIVKGPLNTGIDQFEYLKTHPVSKLEVTTAPNPFKDNIRFNVVSPESGRLTILIYDIDGMKRGEIEGDVLKNIPATLWYRNNQQTQGVLFYRVFVNKLGVTGKLIQIN